MNAISIDKNSTLVANRYNIMEPLHGELVDPLMIDVVFVPLLAFDMKGYRVGYGKGFYDRFLQRCSEDVVKIGFSYFEAVSTISDVHEYDVPLNFCITPMRVYEF
jgi:5-formyltetrahydrofolate cyclo-ligase